MTDSTRLSPLNDAPVARGHYVLYWMQASQRVAYNHALEHAISRANALGVPLVVCFGLMDDYPEANARHYAFMLQGLCEAEQLLRERGIQMVVRHGPPHEAALELAGDAAVVVCDRGYLRHQRRWRELVADGAACRVEQVESDVVVPVETASDHLETAARTLRPKILRLREQYLKPLRQLAVKHPSLRLKLKHTRALDVSDPAKTLAKLKLDRSVGPVERIAAGPAAASTALRRFVAGKLRGYAEGRREPAGHGTSALSAHLHFGQISALEIALKVIAANDVAAEDRDAFLEELIVRRELAANFVFYQPKYDSYEALPAWARRTLDVHRGDDRKYIYSRAELESAATHDEYWNAAQNEMTRSGYMHNSMRMYWGKKVVEWKKTPEEAFADVLHLNNKYFLCGRDANAFANVAWVFGLHDRPWTNRPIFGNVRYMNAAGLERKFDMQAYLRFVETLKA